MISFMTGTGVEQRTGNLCVQRTGTKDIHIELGQNISAEDWNRMFPLDWDRGLVLVFPGLGQRTGTVCVHRTGTGCVQRNGTECVHRTGTKDWDRMYLQDWDRELRQDMSTGQWGPVVECPVTEDSGLWLPRGGLVILFPHPRKEVRNTQHPTLYTS